MKMLPECIYTYDELVKRLEYWQSKLHLEEWLIELKILPKHEMAYTEDDPTGEVLINNSSAAAKIHLVKPEEHGSEAFWPYNMDQVLVHELLHLQSNTFEPDENNDALWKDFHRKLDNMATLLVELDRGPYKQAPQKSSR